MRLRVLVLSLLAVAAVPALALAAAQKGSLHATMTGRAEAPTAGDPDGRGTAEIKFNGNQVCWELSVSKIGKPAAAHIHRGKAGVAGPVVVPLGAAYRSKGCIRSTPATVRAIQARPAGYYVNVHNAKYPNGAVRGQLRNG
jgi:CHRD domain